jgi:hypothetical protein
MRTSILGAAFLLAGTGAATLAAAVVDSNGNGLALNGSDTLFDVTNQIISSCGTVFSTNGDSMSAYQGGGSGVGAGRMDGSGGVGTQAVSPMSSALSVSQYCTNAPATLYGGAPANLTATSAPTLTESLLVGIDGVAIVADQNNSCSQVPDGLGGTTPQNGFGKGTAMTVNLTGGGTSTYTFGDSSSGKIYPNQPSFDALAVLYFGLTNDGQYNCSSDTRKSLIASWGNLFTNSCAAGSAACTTGLTHAWRRSDLSGTTDAFIKVINPPNGTTANGKGAAVSIGIGSLSTVTGAGSGPKSNPFCNSADAQANPATTSFGGSSDYQDLDKLRTPCGNAAGGAAANESVCQGWKNFATGGGANQGDLGVVLPVLIPDSTVTQQTDSFPTATCTSLCALVSVMKAANVPVGYKCPNGGNPVLGGCWMPAVATATNPDPRCVSTWDLKCVGGAGKPDGRVFNMVTIVARSQVAAVQTSNPAVFANIGNKPYQFAEDQNARLIDKSYYRIHHASSLNPDLTVTGTTGLCTENDDTSQIGCLTNADPCSIGYAGREAAKGYPGGSPAQPKALAVNGTAPFTPLGVPTCTATSPLAAGTPCDSSNGTVVASNADPDFGLKALLSPAGSTPLYPFARRLYFATIYGFNKLQGAEKDLAECYATNSFATAALSGHGFVPNPNGVQCVDYPEQRSSTGTPAPNVQGSGNVAFGGCNSGAAAVDACTTTGVFGGPSVLTDKDGNAVPEAVETF